MEKGEGFGQSRGKGKDEKKGVIRGLGQAEQDRMPAEQPQRVRGHLSIRARAAARSTSEDLHTVVAIFCHQNLALPIHSYAERT